MKWKLFFFVLWFLISGSIVFAQSHTISGYVVDRKTGETIIGVNVVVRDTQTGAAADGNGYFRITGLPAGKYTLDFFHIAYAKHEVQVTIQDKSMVLADIQLQPKPVELQEVVVTGKRSEITDYDVETSVKELTPLAIRSIPTSRGDVFKALKYLPGVESVEPFSPLYSVRGSDPGENLILLDGVTIYNPYHFVTSTGMFNLYAIKNVELLVGGFGAEYGGRNSSVLYITTREGNNQKLHGEFEPGIMASKAVLDFPIGKSATMMVSARFHYDLLSRFLFYSPSYFYDMNISLNWKLSQRNRLSLRYFNSRDFFDYSFARYSSYFSNTFDTDDQELSDFLDDFDVIYNMKWRNQAATAILKTVLHPSLYLKTQISGSFFSSTNLSVLNFEYTDEETSESVKLSYQTDISNKITDLGLKSTLSAMLSSNNTLKFGGELNRYFFGNDVSINRFSAGKTERTPILFAGFIEDMINIGRLALRPGIRFSKFNYSKKWYLEPRFNGTLNFTDNTKLKAAIGKYHQYIVSINSQEYELSQFVDYYYPLQNNKPSLSTHYILGLEHALTENSQLSIDLYYKDIARTYTFDHNVSELDIYQFSDKLKQGSGKAYGVELLWQGKWRNFSGWVSYGVSRAKRRYPHIMNGKSILFDYDRTHSFKTVIHHQIHPALSYSGTLRIISGVPKTLENSTKSYFYYNPQNNGYAVYPTYVTERKNNVRLPLFIRLDLGLKKRIRKGLAAELAEFIGAKESYLNANFGNLLFLFHRNVWFYMPVSDNRLYGIGTNYLPDFSIGYTVKF